MEGGRLSRPWHCSKGAQAVYRSGYRGNRGEIPTRVLTAVNHAMLDHCDMQLR